MALRVLESEAVMTADLPLAGLAARLRMPDGWESVPDAAARMEARLIAAMSATELRLGQILFRRTIVVGGSVGGGTRLALPIAPVLAVIAVCVDRGAGLVEIDDPRLIDGDVFVRTPFREGDDVRVEVVAGYGTWADVPASLREVVMLEAERAETDDVTVLPLLETLSGPFRRLRLGARR